MNGADHLMNALFAGNPPTEEMVLRVTITPDNYDLIYKAMDLKSAYSIVKEYTAEMKDDEFEQKLQFLQTAKAERILGEKAIRKGDAEKAQYYIGRLCNLAVQVRIR